AEFLRATVAFCCDIYPSTDIGIHITIKAMISLKPIPENLLCLLDFTFLSLIFVIMSSPNFILLNITVPVVGILFKCMVCIVEVRAVKIFGYIRIDYPTMRLFYINRQKSFLITTFF